VGPNGLQRLGPCAADIVVVDVLRFSTAVSVAVERGATVLPYTWEDDRAETYAAQHNALWRPAARTHRPAPAGRSRPWTLPASAPARGWCCRHPTDRSLPTGHAGGRPARRSSRELVGRGRHDDVVAAAALDVAAIAPVLVGAAFVGAPP
jgi:hypothetical protein